MKDKTSLVIFTCEKREHLLRKTFDSFSQFNDGVFKQIILSIDGPLSTGIIDYIAPDIIIQSHKRQGYVNNIINALKVIDTEFLFILEDDWSFHRNLNLPEFYNKMEANPEWTEVIFSKTGPLTDEEKFRHLSNDLYEYKYGFSTNPSLIRTSFIKEGFDCLKNSKKGDTLGEDGFENFLSRYAIDKGLYAAVHDPVAGTVIAHEGYLESTPRNWHMTNSIEKRTQEHLLTIPAPSFFRRLRMVIKLLISFIKLSIVQFSNNKVYEFCFRIVGRTNTEINEK
ncbi:MAG: glycosyltransferase [Sphingobacteriales bacterium]|nr:MAG: glycosyltransferase [Sphingobacteriales bacterium]